jgi:hypothetical protein
MGFRLVTGFIEHLYTQLITTSNYNTITDLHTLQITTVHVSLSFTVFPSRCLVTALNNRDSSASVLMSLPIG